MCFICVSLEKDKIRPSQVKEYLEEFEDFIDDEHYAEVASNLIGPQKKGKKNKRLKMPGPQGWAMVDDDEEEDLFHWSHNLDWGRD